MLLHFCSIKPRKLKIMLNKANITSESVHFFIRLVEAVKANATVINRYYPAVIWHQKAWQQEESIIPVKTPSFMCYCVCLESVWHIVACLKVNFLQY